MATRVQSAARGRAGRVAASRAELDRTMRRCAIPHISAHLRVSPPDPILNAFFTRCSHLAQVCGLGDAVDGGPCRPS